MSRRLPLFVGLLCMSSSTSLAQMRWQSVGVGDCPGQDRASSRGAEPDPGKCTDRASGTAAVCWDGKTHRHQAFGHAACTYKSVTPEACKGGRNPGRMYRCARAPAPATVAAGATWVRVGVGDCPGGDRGGSRGAAPDPGKCTERTAGTAAVCWDGRAHRHHGFGHAACTYKTTAASACKGGRNPGVMYRCVPRTAAPGWRRVGVGDCPGQDRASSRGAAPDPGKCTERTAGTAAVCWDGKAHRHQGFGHAACTYKSVAPRACRGGKNPGIMYHCTR